MNNTLYSQVRTGSTQEGTSWYDWQIVDWDVMDVSAPEIIFEKNKFYKSQQKYTG